MEFIIQFIVALFATLSLQLFFPLQKRSCFTAVLQERLAGSSTI